MIPDVGSTYRFRNRRISDTLEDTLVLLRFRLQGCFERSGLAYAADQISMASSNALAHLLHDPKVCMWSLVDLTPLMESPESAEVLQMAESLAEQINYMALGVANLDRRRFSAFVRPLPNGAFIPGTGVSLIWPSGRSQPVEVRSEIDGTFLVCGAATIESRWRSVSGFTLPCGDPLLVPPPLEGYELSSIDVETVSQWEELLARIRPLLGVCPQTTQMISAFGSFLLPLKSSKTDAHLSVSFKHRPGIIYASWSQNVLEVLEAIAHEADHQCLLEVINEDALLADDPINSRPAFRSPWRNDPRPLSGLFFGFSAFVTVGAFWAGLLGERLADMDRAGRRAVLALEQSLDALSIVSSRAVLTSRGKQFLEYNRNQAIEALEKLQTYSGFQHWQNVSRERRDRDAMRWRQDYRGEDMVTEMRP